MGIHGRAASLTGAIMLLLGPMAPTVARPYTVEDLLRTEDIGKATFDPNGRWLVFEWQDPSLAMQRFDAPGIGNVMRSRLYRVDLHGAWRAEPLLANVPPGMAGYGFSPDGSRFAVARLVEDRWQLGIVHMRSGRVRWLDLSPDYDPFRVSLRWISENRLVVIANPGGGRPWSLSMSGYPADVLPARWQAARAGKESSVTAVGSGRFQNQGAPPPNKALTLLDVQSGQISTLATGDFLSLETSPNHEYVALLERGPPAPLPQNRPVSQIDGPFRQRVALYDLGTSELWRPCADCDVQGAPQWSSHGEHLAYLARRDGDDWPEARLFDINAPGRSLTRLDAGDVAPIVGEFPDGTARGAFHWRGLDLLSYGRPRSGSKQRGEWYLVAGDRTTSLTTSLPGVAPEIATIAGCETAMSISAGIWCLDAATPRQMFGAGTRLSNGNALGWARTGNKVAFRAAVLDGRQVTLGTGGRIDRVEASPLGNVVVLSQTGANGVKTLSLISGDRFQAIAELNLHLQSVEPAIFHRLSYPLANGQMVTSWLYVPSDRNQGKKLGLVTIPYPGRTYGSEAPDGHGPEIGTSYTNAQVLAGHGYAVLLPSLPDRLTPGDRMTNLADDLGRAIDAAEATGMIDPHREALWGHSFGGYAVAMVAAQTCRYASVIASSGIYDLAAVPGTFGPIVRLAPEHGLPVGQFFAWAETGQGKLEVPPWEDPARYVAASPLYQLGRINTPILIVAADRDYAPLEQAEQVFSGLYRQNKDAQLITYWGEGHYIGSPANIRDLYDRVFGWLSATMDSPSSKKCAARPTSNGDK